MPRLCSGPFAPVLIYLEMKPKPSLASNHFTTPVKTPSAKRKQGVIMLPL